MANPRRGEIVAEFDGKPHSLCLTLGALAELEAKFAAGNLVELATRFESGQMTARDLIAIIACGLRGAGETVSDNEVATFKVAGGLHAYIRIAADLLAATFGEMEPDADAAANPRLPQDA
ncbi:MAG: gene transfer agent family protein [Beijerinckiaceae bacterium]